MTVQLVATAGQRGAERWPGFWQNARMFQDRPAILNRLDINTNYLTIFWRVRIQSDTWTEQDRLDLAAFSLQYAATAFPEDEDIAE
ncbi:hypothetical protein [Nodosilinea sp. LEGE 07088]|uniref:hypothetical protein n=1 Tax=Nodosilinea sp. LEGE 07088 TaxID=2777968 RepID=UPI001D15C072|nr:hypothetical protein [Nodosilinea sp. LEGE 07088]